MDDDFDEIECAVEMLRLINGGKTPAKVRLALKQSGYTAEQIAIAGQVLIDAQ